jgi:hypothetical protein
MHRLDPVQQPAIQPPKAGSRLHHNVRHEYDVGPVHLVDAILRDNADAGHELHRLFRGRHDSRDEDRIVFLIADKTARCPQRVEYAVNDRGIAFGENHQAHVNWISHEFGSIASEAAILPLNAASGQPY